MRPPLLVAMLVLASCDPRQNFEVPEWTTSRMLDQPKYVPYGESPLGDTVLGPVAGTIARDEVLGPEALVSGRVGDQDVTRLPLPVTRELVLEGKRAFDTTCAACHGLVGDGVSVVATKMQQRPPPSLHEPRVAMLPPGRIFQIITAGYGLMPSMRPLVPTLQERWAVVAYVEALTLSQHLSASRLTPDERAQLEALP